MSLDHALNGHRPNGAAIIVPDDWRDHGEPRKARLALEWAKDIEPRQGEWLVKNLIPARGAGSMFGPSRSGKSFLALEWCLRLASGDDVLGMRTRRAGVAYVAPEAPNGVRKRVCAWLQEHGDEDRVPFALIGRAIDLSSPETADVEELITLLLEAREEFEMEGAGLGLIVIDTLARAMTGRDENSAQDMGAAIAALDLISERTGAFVLAVHHTGKDATKGARGHSSFFAALDTAIEITHDDESGIRRLRVAKQKDGEDGREWGFNLRSVEIGLDADGDPVTSCVIDYTDAPPQRPKRKGGAAARAAEGIVLTALDAVVSNVGARPPIGIPCPSDRFAARRDDVREHAFKIGLSKGSETRAAQRTNFNRAQQELVRLGTIAVWDDEARGEQWMWRK